jgi:phosphatidylserine/phosphatidylglycerophosphate/cardiolipin synthase-like enzyme
MTRRGALAPIALIACGALAVSGCKVGNISVSATPSASTRSSVHHPASHHASSHPRHSAPAKHKKQTKKKQNTQQPVSLLAEPAAGFSPVYTLFARAKHSIDVTMYEFTDTTAEHDLAAAARRGVHVEVILDGKESSENQAAYRYLGAHGAKVVWSSSAYYYTHQKTLIIDGDEAVIMTANLTSSYYATSRDFLVLDSVKADVAAISATFNADFAHRAITPGNGADLVWSPTDSQTKLLSLINGATKSLRIYSEEMGDTVIENALTAAARRGVEVQVCGENESGEYDSAYAKLARAGVHIAYFSNPDGFYIHGKVVEADYGTSQARAFIGSENFSSTSLNRNRELGLITATPSVLSAIATAFAGDFQRGTHWS